MNLVPLDSITIPDNRQRQEFDEGSIIALAEDIVANDLINAVAVRDTDPPILIAGERRLRAIEMLYRKGKTFRYNGQPTPPNLVPVALMTPRDELEYLRVEYAENVQRRDLTWQERARANARMAELAAELNDEPVAISALTAERGVVGNRSKDTLRDDLALAAAMGDTDIASAKTKREAVKILQRKRNEEHQRKLAEEFGNRPNGSVHDLRQGDMRNLLPSLPKASVDVLLTDPPYGVGAHTFGNQTEIDHEYDDSLSTWIELVRDLAIESFRVCKDSAHAYVMCDIRNWAHLATMFEVEGWDPWPRPLIWYKGNQGTLPRPEHGPRLTYEAIMYAIKGDRKVLAPGHDVLSIPTGTKPRHAAEKPPGLFYELLRRSAMPGDTVLDPFAGSGTILPAANKRKCKAIAFELDERFFGLCTSRLKETFDDND